MKGNFYLKLHQSWPDKTTDVKEHSCFTEEEMNAFMVQKLKFLLNYELLLNQKKKNQKKKVLILRAPFYFIQNNEGRMSRNITFAYFLQCKL